MHTPAPAAHQEHTHMHSTPQVHGVPAWCGAKSIAEIQRVKAGDKRMKGSRDQFITIQSGCELDLKNESVKR